MPLLEEHPNLAFLVFGRLRIRSSCCSHLFKSKSTPTFSVGAGSAFCLRIIWGGILAYRGIGISKQKKLYGLGAYFYKRRNNLGNRARGAQSTASICK